MSTQGKEASRATLEGRLQPPHEERKKRGGETQKTERKEIKIKGEQYLKTKTAGFSTNESIIIYEWGKCLENCGNEAMALSHMTAVCGDS